LADSPGSHLAGVPGRGAFNTGRSEPGWDCKSSTRDTSSPTTTGGRPQGKKLVFSGSYGASLKFEPPRRAELDEREAEEIADGNTLRRAPLDKGLVSHVKGLQRGPRPANFKPSLSLLCLRKSMDPAQIAAHWVAGDAQGRVRSTASAICLKYWN